MGSKYSGAEGDADRASSGTNTDKVGVLTLLILHEQKMNFILLFGHLHIRYCII